MLTLFRLIFWFVLWVPTWLLTILFKDTHEDNCMTWAVRKWDTEGGYLVVRWCRSSRFEWLRWPHFLWLPEDKNQDLQHVIPINDDYTKQFVPNPWFDPQHIQGDDELIKGKEN